jgi:hypothetical protein
VYLCCAPGQIIVWLAMLINIFHFRAVVRRLHLVLLIIPLLLMQTASCLLLPYLLVDVQNRVGGGLHFLLGFISFVLWAGIAYPILERAAQRKTKVHAVEIEGAEPLKLEASYILGDDGEIVEIPANERLKRKC